MEENEIDDKLFNFILTNIKLIIPEDSNVNEEVIKLYINKTCHDLTVKTNRNEFPEGLKYLVIDIVSDIVNLSIQETNANNNQNIQSMSETGRSVTFGASDTTKTKINLMYQQKLEDNEKLINKYRLLYKTGCDRDAKS